MTILRPYQAEDIETLLQSLAASEHPVCDYATGGGKSVLISALCQRLDWRILVVTHRKELIEQNESALLRMADEDTGVYSAGIGRREMEARVIFAGVQSIYNRMDDLQAAGPFRYVMIDESHLVSPRDQPSMYSTILEACPTAQRIGFSATPYRLNDGPIWGDNACWFDSRPVHRGITELTRMGYLSPLVGVETAAEIDLSKVRSRAGDYVLSDLSQVSSEDSVVKAACDEICYLAQDRHSWLVFAVDRAHAAIVADELISRGISTEIILGNTHKDERRERLARFKSGGFRALVNVGVLTTGFDAPNVDCIAMLRATQSKSLFIQCIGRATRLHEGKKDALVLDMGGNLARHMPIDGIPEVSLSPKRAEKKRQEQAMKRRERKARHGAWAARGIDPLADVATGSEMLLVENVKYFFKKAKKYPSRTNIVVTYQCVTPEGAPRNVQQFVLPEYPARPGLEARAWFERRGLPMPKWANQVRYTLPKAPVPSAIVVTKAGGWDKVTMEMFDEVSV